MDAQTRPSDFRMGWFQIGPWELIEFSRILYVKFTGKIRIPPKEVGSETPPDYVCLAICVADDPIRPFWKGCFRCCAEMR